MDPNATLDEIIRAARAGELDGAMEACANLLRWLRSGGFKPHCPPRTYVAVGDGSGTAYTILSSPRGFAVFRRWSLIRPEAFVGDAEFVFDERK
jgi:hypothetical protein